MTARMVEFVEQHRVKYHPEMVRSIVRFDAGVLMSEPKTTKPKVKLTGTDSNVFSLLGKCTRALKDAGMRPEAEALATAVMGAKSYDEALQFMMAAVDVS